MVTAQSNGCQLHQTHVSTVKKKYFDKTFFSQIVFKKSYPPLRVHARTENNENYSCRKKEDQLTCHEHISQSKEGVSCNGRHYTSYIPW